MDIPNIYDLTTFNISNQLMHTIKISYTKPNTISVIIDDVHVKNVIKQDCIDDWEDDYVLYEVPLENMKFYANIMCKTDYDMDDNMNNISIYTADEGKNKCPCFCKYNQMNQCEINETSYISIELYSSTNIILYIYKSMYNPVIDTMLFSNERFGDSEDEFDIIWNRNYSETKHKYKQYFVKQRIDMYIDNKYIQQNKKETFIRDMYIRTNKKELFVVIKIFKINDKYYTIYIHKIIYKSNCYIISIFDKNNTKFIKYNNLNDSLKLNFTDFCVMYLQDALPEFNNFLFTEYNYLYRTTRIILNK